MSEKKSIFSRLIPGVEVVRLIKNLAILAVLGFLGYLVWNFFAGKEEKPLTIDKTPMQIESIRSIAEIATVSYQDEIVVDSVEYYDGSFNVMKPGDWSKAYNKVVNRNIKRRLTMIIGGEVRYGVDLTNNEPKIEHRNDSVWIQLPKVKAVDIIVAPSKNEVFQEIGTWKDWERRKMEGKAKRKLLKNAKNFELPQKAKNNIESLFRQIIPKEKVVFVEFE